MSFRSNAKPKLLGADTHAASVTMAEGTNTGQTQASAFTPSAVLTTRATAGNNGAAFITFASITTPTEDSVLVIVVSSANVITTASNYDKDWLLKRGTTTIDTFSLIGASTTSTEVDTRVFIDTSPTAGTNTYTLEDDDGVTFGAVTAQLFFITGDGTLTGANTDSTHETEVLP